MLSLFKKYNSNGCLFDNRPPSEKQKDVKFDEIVAKANAVQWREKPESEWRKFPDFDQNGAGCCVAASAKKLLGIYYQQKYGDWVDFSAAHIYQRRINKPSLGMFSYDLWNILKQGTTLEDFAPSKGDDSKLDSVQVTPLEADIGTKFKIDTSIDLIPGNLGGSIDEVASVIETTGKGIMAWFYFTPDEWSRDIPIIKDYSLNILDSRACHHSVSIVDYTLYYGKKAFIIEDSAWFGGIKRRIILEEFFQKRNYYLGYFMNFKFESDSTRPRHTFNVDLSFGMSSPEVIFLQECLKYDGVFPSNVDSTGYFGTTTLDSVKRFQSKYGISPVSGYVGNLTRSKLNELFS